MYCSNCGKEIGERAVICVGCGVPARYAYIPNRQNWLVVLLLTIFLGALGIHRFYTGHIKSGILQLLFTISFFGSFITAVWVLIDIISIATNNFKTKSGEELVKC